MMVSLNWHGFTQTYDVPDDRKPGDRLHPPIVQRLRPDQETSPYQDVVFRLRQDGTAFCDGCPLCDPRRDEKLIQAACRETLRQASSIIGEQATAAARSLILRGRVIGYTRGYVEVAAGKKAADLANPWLVPVDKAAIAKRLDRQKKERAARRAKAKRQAARDAARERRRR